jgi:hypothetical protein
MKPSCTNGLKGCIGPIAAAVSTWIVTGSGCAARPETSVATISIRHAAASR